MTIRGDRYDWKRQVKAADAGLERLVAGAARGLPRHASEYRILANRILRAGQRGEELLEKSALSGTPTKRVDDLRELCKHLGDQSERLRDMAIRHLAIRTKDWPLYVCAAARTDDLVRESASIREIDALIEEELEDGH